MGGGGALGPPVLWDPFPERGHRRQWWVSLCLELSCKLSLRPLFMPGPPCTGPWTLQGRASSPTFSLPWLLGAGGREGVLPLSHLPVLQAGVGCWERFCTQPSHPSLSQARTSPSPPARSADGCGPWGPCLPHSCRPAVLAAPMRPPGFPSPRLLPHRPCQPLSCSHLPPKVSSTHRWSSRGEGRHVTRQIETARGERGKS